MRKLVHKNIIRLYEVYEGMHHVYLVMDLLKGGELFDTIVKNNSQTEKNVKLKKNIYFKDISYNILIILSS